MVSLNGMDIVRCSESEEAALLTVGGFGQVLRFLSIAFGALAGIAGLCFALRTIPEIVWIGYLIAAIILVSSVAYYFYAIKIKVIMEYKFSDGTLAANGKVFNGVNALIGDEFVENGDSSSFELGIRKEGETQIVGVIKGTDLPFPKAAVENFCAKCGFGFELVRSQPRWDI